jgi:serine/threonine-protein kinase
LGAGTDDIATANTGVVELLAGRYTILGLLGVGGMGRVYRAHDRTLDETIALKMLRRELVGMPGMLDRFRQEVKLARQVTSPYVVRTFDLGQHGDDHYLTMEYIDGSSLTQRIADGPLAIADVIRVALATAEGIAAAHANHVLHRDLKPDNILVAKTGRIAISDFGIARPDGATLATGDRFVGTPAYMAPEQVEGAGVIGAPADIYAFGAILFEMLTGRRPFVGGDPFAVALARLHEAPDPRVFRAIPGPLADLTLRCMARDPRERLADGPALVAALAGIGELEVTTGPARAIAILPARSARTIAILPLQASPELAEVADGLSEEIADALSMTRALRVRPLSSVRATGSHGDSRAIGADLSVDVVVDGSIRRRGDRVRLSARAIGVADGFQLWASHFDTAPEGLLTAGDDIVRAIAGALAIELTMPERPSSATRVAEAYLENKARLRQGWLEGALDGVTVELDRLLPQAPDDPGLVATLAMALARSGFFGSQTALARARPLAERAVALAPASGEAWLALGYACLYAGAPIDAGPALYRAVQHATGLAPAQGTIGALLLETGDLDDAVSHLEAAVSVDPTSTQLSDLARAYIYLGRFEDGVATIRRRPEHLIAELEIRRFQLWRGERHPLHATAPTTLRPELYAFIATALAFHATGQVAARELHALDVVLRATSPRMRAALSQFTAEFLAAAGDLDRAAEYVALSVDAGLCDRSWIERCPVLEPLRERPDFRALSATVRTRAEAVLAAIFRS